MSDKILTALRAAEWVDPDRGPFSTVPTCPVCERPRDRLRPGQEAGHAPGCTMNAAIAEVELAQRPFDMEVARQFLTLEVRAGTLKSFEVHADGRCDMVPDALGSIQFNYIKGTIALMPAVEQAKAEPSRATWGDMTLKEILADPGWPAAMSEAAKLASVDASYRVSAGADAIKTAKDDAHEVARLAAQIGPQRFYDIATDTWKTTDEAYAVWKARRYLGEARRQAKEAKPCA